VGDDRARRDLHDGVGLEVGLARGAQAADRLLQAGPDRGVQRGERVVQGGRGDPGVRHVDAVELEGERAHGLGTTGPYRLDDRRHHVRGGLDVELGARHARAVVDGRRVGTPEVDAADEGHAVDSRFPGGSGRSRGCGVDSGD
jgi:hypothetical protein